MAGALSNDWLSPFELRPGESIIRRDVVRLWHVMSRTRKRRTTYLVVTTVRVLFVPIHITFGRRFLSWLLLLVAIGAPPAHRAHEIELSEIRKLWKWKPALSGPPLIELANGDCWYYRLVVDSFPWRHEVAKNKELEQFEDFEKAWDAARTRSATHDPQA